RACLHGLRVHVGEADFGGDRGGGGRPVAGLAERDSELVAVDSGLVQPVSGNFELTPYLTNRQSAKVRMTHGVVGDADARVAQDINTAPIEHVAVTVWMITVGPTGDDKHGGRYAVVPQDRNRVVKNACKPVVEGDRQPRQVRCGEYVVRCGERPPVVNSDLEMLLESCW